MKNIHIVYSEKYPAYYALAAIEGISGMCDLAQIEYKVPLVELNAAETKNIEDAFYNKRNGKYNEQPFFQNVLPALYNWLGLKGDGSSSIIYLLEGDLYHYAGKGRPYYNWVFGAANIYGGIEAPYRIERRFKAEPAKARAEIFKTLVMHEIGHTLGLVPESAPSHTRSKKPLFHHHCRHSYCTMSQVVSLAELKRNTDERLARQSPLCPDCLKYMIEANRTR
ncbi:MAG: hypothetical protein LBI17_01830 [Rickettsiales bacterium]|jgi:predicted Zn-dependent protease|nr:hypothetical protein [Rickettsiales bacterium]